MSLYKFVEATVYVLVLTVVLRRWQLRARAAKRMDYFRGTKRKLVKR